MSYSFTTRKGTAVTATIPVSVNTSGYTLSVELSPKSSFVGATSKSVTGSGKNITLSLSASEVDTLKDTRFRVKALKDGITSYIQTGTIDYIAPVVLVGSSGVDLLGSDGKIKTELLPASTASLPVADFDTIFVASSTASADEKALATPTYTCDGTADNVQIQAALDAVKAAGGGRVVLSAGLFNIATPVAVIGSGDTLSRNRVAIQGSGLGVTQLRTFAGTSSSFHLTSFAMVDISDMTFFCYGGSNGITSAAPATNTWAFWRSTFKNLYFEGTSDGLATGWAMNLEGPFRSVFENIDAAGMVNGINLYNASSTFFAGNCVFRRVFVLTNGSNGYGFRLGAATGTILNAIQFDVCEGYAGGGTGNTGVHLGYGGGQVNHTRWNTTNFENYDTVLRIENGIGNIIDGDYWDTRHGAAANATTLIQFDSAARGNKVTSITGHYTNQAMRLAVNNAGDVSMPNIVENVYLVVDSAGAVTSTNALGGTLITRNINAAGAGAANASTVAKSWGDAPTPAQSDNSTAIATTAFVKTWAPSSPAAGTAGLRALGIGATNAASGTDSRFTTLAANTQTGTAYTLVGGDARKVVEMNNAAANTVTIPTNASVQFAVGTVIDIQQIGAGVTTISPIAGVTLRSTASPVVTTGQYSRSIRIRKRATDEWIVM